MWFPSSSMSIIENVFCQRVRVFLPYEFPQHPWKKVFDAVFLGAAMQIPSLLQIEAECGDGALCANASDRSATTPSATRSKDNLPNQCLRSVVKLPAA